MDIELPIIAHYKQNLKSHIEIDYSDYISSKVLFELGKDQLLYFVALYLKTILVNTVIRFIRKNY